MENLPLIERVIAHVSRTGRLFGADGEDFASVARLALIQNDYAVLSRYDGRAPLGAYLAVVLHRLMGEERRPSAETKRMGSAGMGLEKLLRREHASAAGDDPAPGVHETERRGLSDAKASVLRQALGAMTSEDRVLLKMRFASSMKISSIARMLNVPQRPLQRRIDALLETLRAAFAGAGIDGTQVSDLIGSTTSELGLGWEKTGE